MATERLEIVANFVELCSYCGAPCSGTILVSYRDGGRRVAFETDRPGLTLPIEELVGAAIERGEYDTLPSFAREWNEARGWAEFASDGAPVAAGDLLQVVDVLDARRPAEGSHAAMLRALRAFVAVAAREGREVWSRGPEPFTPSKGALNRALHWTAARRWVPDRVPALVAGALLVRRRKTERAEGSTLTTRRCRTSLPHARGSRSFLRTARR